MKQFFFKIGILCFASAIVFCGCQKDDDLNPPSGTGDNTDNANSNLIINNWIDGIMREKYLWYNDIPDRNRLNYGNTPTQFFKSLLSEQERGEKAGYYSTIEKNTTSARSINSVTLSYGMEYTLYRLPNTQYYVARILYVLPNSPATEAGIKRGDWIIASNGTPITADNYNQLLSSGTQAVLSTMIYNETTDEFIEGDNIQIAAARSVENNPIFLDTVYSHGTEKIGYLVYNNFITGKNGYNDKGYLTEMVKCFERFKAQNVNRFILDLRYNGGGYIDCSQWLGTELAPASALDKTFAYTLANDKQSKRKEILSFIAQAKSGNLDLPDLYVLTSSLTASASETVINSLRAYMNVTIIGTQTEGKNVGGTIYENTQLGYTITPITFKVYNALDKSDFNNGFVPEHIVDEAGSMEQFYDLGDTREKLLSKAILLITGTENTSVNVKSSARQNLLELSPFHSLLRYDSYGKLLKQGE